MYSYRNPFAEISQQARISIELDYDKQDIIITLFNNNNISIENVLILSHNDKLLLNPILLPTHQVVVKRLFWVDLRNYKEIEMLSSLDNKYHITKQDNPSFQQDLKFVINGYTYVAKGVDFGSIIRTVSTNV